MRHLSSIALLLLLCGCSGRAEQIFYSETMLGANHATFEHPFTDAGAADARSRANKQCAHKKLVAVRTSRKCSLTDCITNYHCMDEEEAAGYPADERTK